MIQIFLTMKEQTLEEIDARAEAIGITRAAMVKALVHEALAKK